MSCSEFSYATFINTNLIYWFLVVKRYKKNLGGTTKCEKIVNRSQFSNYSRHDLTHESGSQTMKIKHYDIAMWIPPFFKYGQLNAPKFQ